MKTIAKMQKKLSMLLGRRLPTVRRCRPQPLDEEQSVASSLLKKLDMIGSQLVQDILSGVHQQAGGLTTATIMGRALIDESNEYISRGADPKQIRVGLMAAVDEVIRQLNAMARPIHVPSMQLLRVAITSAQGDRAIGGLIYQAIKRAGLEGDISIKTTNTADVELRFSYMDADAAEPAPSRICHLDRWVTIPAVDTLLSQVYAVVFLVGGSSEADKHQKKKLITDAVMRTRAAVEGGLVPGGGTALIRCMKPLDSLMVDNKDQRLGVRAVRRALRMPCWTIAQNCNIDGSQVARVMEEYRMCEDLGFDVVSGRCCSMSVQGIMDPTKVVRSAVTNAAGMASLLITDHEFVSESDN
ncbi:heat shock protein 60A-like [Drosophila guanche]|uniref:Blast:60 kDa heat shock protein, mitochondrial n=1 Tax=Drosophila guanche TaxID=7266 RepID=A0A3B0K9L7_DROGU|nr:heat shock protein 60A-like [Drosophila guanche]SPP89392.1 blast:60 kDa heat shock protein%2C mitochondrial [Drosophila guanche]